MKELTRFRQFLNENEDSINEAAYGQEAYFDKLIKEFEVVKKALIDVARVQIASAAYGYGYDAREAGIYAMEKDWEKNLRADFNAVKSNMRTYIDPNYLKDEYWNGDPNKIFVYIRENIDDIIDGLDTKLRLVNRLIDGDGEDLNDEKVKEKYKVKILLRETIKKTISTLEEFKKTLAADPRNNK